MKEGEEERERLYKYIIERECIHTDSQFSWAYHWSRMIKYRSEELLKFFALADVFTHAIIMIP